MISKFLLSLSFIFCCSCNRNNQVELVEPLFNSHISFYKPESFALMDSGFVPTDNPSDRVFQYFYKDSLSKSTISLAIKSNDYKVSSLDSLLKINLINIKSNYFNTRIENAEVRSINSHEFGFIRHHPDTNRNSYTLFLFTISNSKLFLISINTKGSTSKVDEEINKIIASLSVK